MKTYHFLWKMIRYRPWLYSINALLWALIHLAPLIPGLIIQRFFNIFGSQTGSAGLVWSLIALLVAIAIGRGLLFIKYRYNLWIVGAVGLIVLALNFVVLRLDLRHKLIGQPHPERNPVA